MAFGPNSTNPRERRAYADTMLARASSSVALQDFEAAREVIATVGDTAKSRRANFSARLASAALKDATTRAVVELGRKTLDPVATPPKDSTLGNDYIQHKLQERASLNFVKFRSGVASYRSYWERVGDGVVENYGDLTITQHGRNKPYTIPLIDHETVDVLSVRMLPDQTRAEMAALAMQVTDPVLELV